MIDCENEIFNIISTDIRKEYPKIYIVGEYVQTPPSFPCVSLVEMDNFIYTSTQTSSEMENHAEIMFEVNVYSNKTNGKKTECKKIASRIDEKMLELGFTRTTLIPVQNIDDATIYRMTGRYKAVISKNNTIFRR